MAFSWKERQTWFESLAKDPPEVVILGGGVVGCSIASHVAEMGVKCALIERHDLATGASGNSTGLAHAGLRYLAQGAIRYVFQESRERARIERLAPHWVRPFNFLYPVYKQDKFQLPTVRLGTWIYDAMAWLDAALSGRPLPKSHRVVQREELQARVPGLQTEGLQGAAEYFVDAQLQDARFTLGWAQKAARLGARIITYASVSGLHSRPKEPQSMVGTDLLHDKKVEFSAPLVINATGAWIDGVRAQAGWAKPVVTPRQGVHVIVDQIVSSPLIFSTETANRVFFVIPIGKKLSVIGTTDVPTRVAIDDVKPGTDEIHELIRRLFQFFPYLKQGSNLREAIELFKQVHVHDVFWGVRPLVRQEKPVADPSRDHALFKDSETLWSVPGVKLTAARRAGAEVAAQVWKARRKGRPPKPGVAPLPGGDMANYETYLKDAQRRFKVGDQSEDLMAYLVSMYGTRYSEVMRWVDLEPHYREPIFSDEPWLPAQAAFAVQEEMVLTLNDFLWRRSKWAHYRDIPDAGLYKIVSAMADFLGWSPDDVEKQVADYQVELRKHRIPAS